VSTTRPALIVDARAWFGSGIGRVMRECTLRLHDNGSFRNIILVGDPAELTPWISTHASTAHCVPVVAGRYSISTERQWRRIAPALPGDAVTWFPHWDVPFVGQRWPNVVTVHDLIPLLTSGAPRWKRIGMRWWITRALRGATRIATGSRASADVITAEFGARRIDVIPYGSDATTLAPDHAERVLDPALAVRIGDAPFVLIVANRKPHKGFDTALRALAAVQRQWPALRLVTCGESFAHWSEIDALATRLGVRDAIVDAGRVSDATLAALYGRALALLAPSRMEGFGLPLLEAMQQSCPVIASDIPAHREVAGSAATLVPVNDPSALATAILAHRDEAAASRSARVTTAHTHAARYRWDDTAQQLGTLLQEAYASQLPRSPRAAAAERPACDN